MFVDLVDAVASTDIACSTDARDLAVAATGYCDVAEGNVTIAFLGQTD